jgi:hypothetical protein
VKLLALAAAGAMGATVIVLAAFVSVFSAPCVPVPAVSAAPQAGAQAGGQAPGPSGGQSPLSASGAQRQNAAAIVAEVKAEGLPQQAAVDAIAAALAESGLQNLPNGDRDSVGLFQQRPSQGWGTVQQILNPTYATQRFLGALKGIGNWASLPVGTAVQEVQKSAPGGAAYDRWQQAAQQLVGQLWSGTNAAPQQGAPQTPAPAGGGCALPFAGAQAVGSASASGLPWPVPNPIPAPGWRQQIGVPQWPAGMPGTHVNPPAVTNQCVAGALWAWGTMHLSDPGWAKVPALQGDAAQLWPIARAAGFATEGQPKVGDIVVYRAGSFYGTVGHVATVTATAGDRYLVVEQNFINDQTNLLPQWGTWDVRSIAWPDSQVLGFISAPPGVTPQPVKAT